MIHNAGQEVKTMIDEEYQNQESQDVQQDRAERKNWCSMRKKEESADHNHPEIILIYSLGEEDARKKSS